MGRAIVAAAGDEAVTLEATSTETAGAGAGVGVGLEGADTGKAAAATVWVEAASVRVAAEEVPGAGDAADAEVAVEDEEAAVDAVVALSAAAAEEMALGSRFPGAMGGVGRRKREGGGRREERRTRPPAAGRAGELAPGGCASASPSPGQTRVGICNFFMHLDGLCLSNSCIVALYSLFFT
jgi:hypothetical protein